MSYEFNSPYAGPVRAPRWPLVFAGILLLAVVSVTGLMLNGGFIPGSDVNGIMSDATKDVAEANATDTPAPTATFTPVPTPTNVSFDQPTDVGKQWVKLWNAQDYKGMYAMTSPTTRANVKEEEFVSRYQAIDKAAGITKVNAQITEEANTDGAVLFHVEYTSSLVGSIKQDNALHLTTESGKWTVAWTPEAIFPELKNNGCVNFQADSLTRGRILDKNGVLLAEDAPVARISVVPAMVEDADATYQFLSELTGTPLETINARVENSGSPDWPVNVGDLPAKDFTKILNQVQPHRGVIVNKATHRNYPQGAVTAHLVGWVSIATKDDIDRDKTGKTLPDQLVGRSGVELGADELLTGTPGGKLQATECQTGAVRSVIAETKGTAPKDVYLTIDINFQKEVDKALTDAERKDPKAKDANELQARRSAAVIIDPRSGALMAMVSHPTFDPNSFISGKWSQKDEEVINDPLLRAQANRATVETYPTGSIFKVITTSAGLHDLGMTGNTEIDCPQSFQIGGQTWNDWVVENGLSGQGMLTLHQGLVNSCNTVFYQIGAQLDKKDETLLPNMARAYGLGQKTGIPYFQESAGIIPDPKWKVEQFDDGWATGDAVLLSIGQGFMLASPLQMARAYAAIANGGEVLQPFVVDRAGEQGKDPEQIGKKKVVGRLPLSDEQIVELQSMLRDQTSDPNGFGSSRVFGDFGWPISGKTGTAQNDLDHTDRPHSWFAAYGPYPGDGEAASISSVVLVENAGEGVAWAAPITRQIYSAYVSGDAGEPQAPAEEPVEETPEAYIPRSGLHRAS